MVATGGWTLTDHACRYCGGRILANGGQFSCATCGAVTQHEPHGICGCGMMQVGRARGSFRCVANPDKGAHSPAEIVIQFGEQAKR